MSTEAAAIETSPGPLIFSALKDRAPKIATAVALGTASYPTVKSLYQRAKNASGYVITIHGTDPMYDVLHQWVMEKLPEKKHRALMAYSGEAPVIPVPGAAQEVPDSIGGAPKALKNGPTKRLLFRYNGSRVQHIKVNGHRVAFSTLDADKQQVGDRLVQIKPPKITLSVQSKSARDSLVGVLKEVFAKTLEKKVPAFYLGTSWGSWDKMEDVPQRTLDSVILEDDQLERIVSDLERFLGAEEEYVSRSIPWHRGYLFEGPPGTGKTSLARALAHRFGLDVRYVSISDVDGDTQLLQLVKGMRSGSVLIIEDIDVFHAATQRDDKSGGVTMSGLLNALDGIATPSGIIKILSSNHSGVLDSALIRPGRVDVVEHFGHADSERVRRLFEWFYDTEIVMKPKKLLVSPAEVNGIMQRHPHDPAVGDERGSSSGQTHFCVKNRIGA